VTPLNMLSDDGRSVWGAGVNLEGIVGARSESPEF
jgi:hypothetical protein